MARNPDCVRLAAATLCAISPADLSEAVYGVESTEGLSPFAIRRGERFEDALFDKNCERLLGVYQRSGRLTAQENLTLDISKLHPETDERGLAARLEASLDLVRRRAAGEAGLPNLVIKPRLTVTVLGRAYSCEPDALVASGSDRSWRVVEIKSYADRHSSTDAVKTGSACRQAAVGFLALSQSCEIQMPEVADLVFAKPGTNWPTLHSLHISGELSGLKATLASAEAYLSDAAKALSGRSLDELQALESVANNPCSGCSDHCALWDGCFQGLVASGRPELMGDAARELLRGFGSLDEVVEARSSGVHTNPDMSLVAEMLQVSEADYQKGLLEL